MVHVHPFQVAYSADLTRIVISDQRLLSHFTPAATQPPPWYVTVVRFLVLVEYEFKVAGFCKTRFTHTVRRYYRA